VRSRVLCLVPITAALLLSGCYARDPYVSSAVSTVRSGNWRIERQTDRVTSAPVASAYTISRSTSNSGILFPPQASLQLACFIDKPVVKFTFGFKIGTNQNSFLGYRFDDRPGHDIGGRFLQNSMAVIIDEPAEVAPFVSELATGKLLYIRIRSFNAGRTSAEFNVGGADDAIKAALAGCPAKPAATTPHTASLSASQRRR
jgi:hypothetical protein